MKAMLPQKALSKALCCACAFALCAALPMQAWAATEVDALEGLISALAAEGDDGEITVTKKIEVAAGSDVTLDLNGKKVSYTSDVAGDAMIDNKGNLVIADNSANGGGELVYTYTGTPDSTYSKGNYTILNTGNVEVASGVVRNGTAAMPHASYAISSHSGEVVVSGGEVINENGIAIRVAPFIGDTSLVVDGGYVEGTRAVQVQLPSSNPAVAGGASVSVTGGELKSNEDVYNLGIYVYSNGESAANTSVSVSGGTINGNVAVNGAATRTMAERAVSVTGGAINGEYGVYSYADDEIAVPVIAITGGSFATDYSRPFAKDGFDFLTKDDGTFEVKKPGSEGEGEGAGDSEGEGAGSGGASGSDAGGGDDSGNTSSLNSPAAANGSGEIGALGSGDDAALVDPVLAQTGDTSSFAAIVAALCAVAAACIGAVLVYVVLTSSITDSPSRTVRR